MYCVNAITKLIYGICGRQGMKQKLAFKQKLVTLQKEKTLKDVLSETLQERGIELANLEKIANQIIFSVDNVMVRDLASVIKAGQTVRLIPAVKAG